MQPAITLHCPLFKVMLLKIGNPPSPLMCCSLKNTKRRNTTGLIRDFVSFVLGGHVGNYVI
jgi:hypothetical protein